MSETPLAEAAGAPEPESSPQDIISEAFDCVDEDGSGFLEIGELKAVVEYLGIEGEAKTEAQLLKILDTDGDGRISKSEFAAYCEKNSKLPDSLVQMQKEKQAKSKLAKLRWKKAGTKVKSVVRFKEAMTLKSAGYTALRALSNPADVTAEAIVVGAKHLGNPTIVNKNVELLPYALPMHTNPRQEDSADNNPSTGVPCVMLFGLAITIGIQLTICWYAMQMVILGSKTRKVADIEPTEENGYPVKQDMSQCRHLGTLGLFWGLWMLLMTFIQISVKCCCPPKPKAAGEPEERSSLHDLSGIVSSLFVGYGIRYTFNRPTFHKNDFGNHMCDDDLFEIVYGFSMFSVIVLIALLPCVCCMICCVVGMKRRSSAD